MPLTLRDELARLGGGKLRKKDKISLTHKKKKKKKFSKIPKKSIRKSLYKYIGAINKLAVLSMIGAQMSSYKENNTAMYNWPL